METLGQAGKMEIREMSFKRKGETTIYIYGPHLFLMNLRPSLFSAVKSQSNQMGASSLTTPLFYPPVHPWGQQVQSAEAVA